MFIYALQQLFRWSSASFKRRRPLLRYLQVHKSKPAGHPSVRGQLTHSLAFPFHSFTSVAVSIELGSCTLLHYYRLRKCSGIYLGEKHTFPTRIPARSSWSIQALSVLHAPVWMRVQPLMGLQCTWRSCSYIRLSHPQGAWRSPGKGPLSSGLCIVLQTPCRKCKSSDQD